MNGISYDVLVVGGGFFGCSLALEMRRRGHSVLLVEREADLLLRASYANQARIHRGYHYPRSILTALRSRVNFPEFNRDFQRCVDSSFTKLYAIGKRSKVNAPQYRSFCERIGAPLKQARPAHQRLFNPDLIEAVFEVEEYAFDAVILKNDIRDLLALEDVTIWLNSEVKRLAPTSSNGVLASVRRSALGDVGSVIAGQVFICTYSQINQLLADSAFPLIPLKHEMTEMALIRVPEQIRHLGITVMCGPFFSTMPFPPRAAHTLSHVRYTPHCEWTDITAQSLLRSDDVFDSYRRESRFPHMIRDVQRYLPSMATAEYLDSIWEVKTVLPQSEVDDSRPILFRRHHGAMNVHVVMGGKIDNIYDVLQELVTDYEGAIA